jgi:hypothetical protein
MARPPSSYIVQIFTAVGYTTFTVVAQPGGVTITSAGNADAAKGYTPLPWTSGCPGSAYLSGSAE